MSCVSILTSGKRKGEVCGKNVKSSDRCGIHSIIGETRKETKISNDVIDYTEMRKDMNPYLYPSCIDDKEQRKAKKPSLETMTDISRKYRDQFSQIFFVLLGTNEEKKAVIFCEIMDDVLTVTDKDKGLCYFWNETDLLWEKHSMNLFSYVVSQIFRLIIDIGVISINDNELEDKVLNFIDKQDQRQLNNIVGWIKCLMCSTSFEENMDVFHNTSCGLSVGKYIVDTSVKNEMVRSRTKRDMRSFSAKWNLIDRNEVDFHRIDRFIDDITLGDAKMRELLLVVVGSSLLGKNKWNKLYVLIGSGLNGKSTFFDILSRIFGDLYHTATKGVFMFNKLQNKDGPSSHIADLENKFIVALSETSEDDMFDEGQIKGFTGKDLINARFLHKEKRIFKPTFTPFILTNNLPSHSGAYATNKRIVVLDFKCSFVDNPKHPNERKVDLDFASSLDNNDLSAMFYLFLDGLKKAMETRSIESLSIDPSIAKTAKCQSVHDFISDVMVSTPGNKLKSRDIHTRYKIWCEENEEREILTSCALGIELRNNQIQKSKIGGVIYYIDYSFKD